MSCRDALVRLVSRPPASAPPLFSEAARGTRLQTALQVHSKCLQLRRRGPRPLRCGFGGRLDHPRLKPYLRIGIDSNRPTRRAGQRPKPTATFEPLASIRHFMRSEAPGCASFPAALHLNCHSKIAHKHVVLLASSFMLKHQDLEPS